MASGVLAEIKSWVDSYTRAHELYAAAPPFKTFPVRAIDVGSEQDSTKIRLVIFAFVSRQPIHCLSHCWGAGNLAEAISKTTHTSLDAHKGIPRNNLLKTFQDAVIITRKLSIRYLWIDSLCIIQQDQSDRETEAAKMASVYGEAYLVIAATAAPDGSYGYLSRRPTEPYRVKIADERNRMHSFSIRESIASHHFHAASEPKPPPLITRAWAFEERFSRVQCFTTAQLSL